jgi:alpha-tubulin suppressor-like RCC1 family protein
LCAPVALAAQTAAPATSIRDIASSQFALVARGDGSVVAWGRAPGGALAVPTLIALPGLAQGVAVGESSAYVLLEDGSVVAWGENDEGQLGNGPSGSNRPLGTYPKASPTPVKVTDLAGIIAIEAGRKHAIALRKDGTVWAWGVRDDGAIGDGDAMPAGSLRVVSATAPVAVRGLTGITQIAAGQTHNLALTRDGKVMSWGSNSTGDGAGHIAALMNDGSVRAWGMNGYGELGLGATSSYEPVPVRVPGLTNVATLRLGGYNSYAIRSDGTLWI